MSLAYRNLGKRIAEQGIWTTNPRTGVRCLTVLNQQFHYTVTDTIPIVTTRKIPWKSAIAELIGYLRGCSSAAQFRELGTRSWDGNANENGAWLKNPNRTGEDDMGRVYGVQGRSWISPDGRVHDQLAKIVRNLQQGIDDRGEILTFWNPGEFDRGCLRPCLYEHQFSIHEGKLHITSNQRSVDYCLGLTWNMIQVHALLLLMCAITGHPPGTVTHNMVNIHVYDNQYETFLKELDRVPYPETAQLLLSPEIASLECINRSLSVADFDLVDYVCHPPLSYPLTV